MPRSINALEGVVMVKLPSQRSNHSCVVRARWVITLLALRARRTSRANALRAAVGRARRARRRGRRRRGAVSRARSPGCRRSRRTPGDSGRRPRRGPAGGHRERLRHVVGPLLRGADQPVLLSIGAEDDDRGIRPVAQVVADVDVVHDGTTEVEHDVVGLVLCDGVDRLRQLEAWRTA